MGPAIGTRWHHLKRGGDYVVEAVAASMDRLEEGDACVLVDGRLRRADPGDASAYRVQASSPQATGTSFCAYRGAKGDGWARPAAEFLDGRFSAID